jgi:hypothetical protein
MVLLPESRDGSLTRVLVVLRRSRHRNAQSFIAHIAHHKAIDAFTLPLRH